MSEPAKRYYKTFSDNMHLQSENARLKAEVERLSNTSTNADRFLISGLEQDVAILKAEVERLTSDLQMEKENEDRLVRLHQDARNEVKRLTKAGDLMASSIQFNEEMAKDYNGPTIVHQSVQRWNAAKEGKQSE